MAETVSQATLSGNGQTVVLEHVPLLTGDLNWSPASLAMEISLAGTPVFEAASQSGGRALVIGGNEAFVDRATLTELQTLAAIPGLEMVYTNHDGRIFNVVFDHRDGNAIEYEPLKMEPLPEDDACYFITLNLITL